MAQVRPNKKRYCGSEHENESSGLAVNSYIMHNLVVSSEKYTHYSPNVLLNCILLTVLIIQPHLDLLYGSITFTSLTDHCLTA
jgi:hypothetical protein